MYREHNGATASPRDPTVYPCVYRERTRWVIMNKNRSGLSLCIQGTRAPRATFSKNDRFIPVYTGNTLFRRVLGWRGAVYPCVYREHERFVSLRSEYSGLSLCIQGTPYYGDETIDDDRFIPVYTGNTFLL